MAATGRIRGHHVTWRPDTNTWVYTDSGRPAAGHSAGDERPCPACGRTAEPDGPDPCLGHIPGATAACCGHGQPGNWPQVTYLRGGES